MGKKLFLSTLIIVLIALALSMLSVNMAFNRQFTNYLNRSTETTVAQLPQRLLSAYKDNAWDRTILGGIADSLPFGTEVILKDPNGQVIATLMNSMEAMHNSAGGMNMSNMMGGDMPYSVQDQATKTVNITAGQKIVGIATIIYPTNARILNPEDASFVSSVFRSLFTAAGLALLLGILLSLLMSRHLVKPLKRLTEAAYRIGQGQFGERVPYTTKDEVGQLAQAFNTMADNLTKQEKLRQQFTADIAHELRTPLTSLRSYIEAFQDGVLPVNSENLASLNEEIDRLVDLSSDLKDLNLAEMGGLKMNVLSVNLNELLEKVLHNLFPLIKEKELILEYKPLPENREVPGDERLLTRLFYNLIHNAYKYTEPKGSITVTLRQIPEYIEILISDTGMGIPEEDLPYIFERFYRTDKSRARETGGSGIGLTLVRQIVLLHKGLISVQSKVGYGSTFSVKLPLA